MRRRAAPRRRERRGRGRPARRVRAAVLAAAGRATSGLRAEALPAPEQSLGRMSFAVQPGRAGEGQPGSSSEAPPNTPISLPSAIHPGPPVDAVVLATGYCYSFPFLDEGPLSYLSILSLSYLTSQMFRFSPRAGHRRRTNQPTQSGKRLAAHSCATCRPRQLHGNAFNPRQDGEHAA